VQHRVGSKYAAMVPWCGVPRVTSVCTPGIAAQPLDVVASHQPAQRVPHHMNLLRAGHLARTAITPATAPAHAPRQVERMVTAVRDSAPGATRVDAAINPTVCVP
jgi:hypothetical protein